LRFGRATVMPLLVILATLSLAMLPGVTASAGSKRCLGKAVTEAGTSHKDRLSGDSGKDIIAGGGGNDRIRLGGGKDRGCGNGGKDRVKGGGGNDRLHGGAGNDLLNGGGGTDTLIGGPGVDICVNGEVTKSCEEPVSMLHIDDGISWDFDEDANGDTPAPGDPVTTTARIGNGIVGAKGYTTSTVPASSFLTGTTTPLAGIADEDDGFQDVTLPFAFPFQGISYDVASVSTNGWLGFGLPAWDYFNAPETFTLDVIGDRYRGVMPYWADLDTNPGATDGDVQMVVAGDGSAVAFQWMDVGFCCTGTAPARNFQVVLFRDGRIRLDYPGSNTSGGADEFVGMTGGTGASSAIEVQRELHAVPSSSVLFAPKDLGGLRSIDAGTLTLSVPHGTIAEPNPFQSASAGCSVTTPATATSDGVVTCATPSLAPGAQATFQVTWRVPESRDLDHLATYTAGGLSATDRDQTALG
jgi:hemolysin type calcium-binding protein